MKKLLSIILAILMIAASVPFAFAADEYTKVYFSYPDGWTNVNVYYWYNSTGLTAWPGDAMTDEGDGLWSYDVPSEATYVIFNNGSEQTGDIAIPTDGSNQYNHKSGVWTIYGSGCDGVPLTVNVADDTWIRIGIDEDYYDEDGYILTGTSENTLVNVGESCDLTLKDVTLEQLRFAYAPEGSVMNITLKGTNVVTGFVMLSAEHLIFEGDETASFKASYLSTGGRDGTVTVNSGNIILDMIADENWDTIGCADFIINGGTVTASNNYYYVVDGPVKLNGGTLNIISTAPEDEAINRDITMGKGALLTVSATYKIIREYSDILMAEGLAEDNSFFVRFDKTSDFAPVYDIKAALENKTYAEIKIDTHDHSFADGFCVCGCPCPYTETVGHLCAVCGETVSECADEDRNHKCDICDEALSVCADADKNHKCDICGETLSECADEDKNHKCDICDETLSECADEDKNHKCDLCGETLSECADEDKNHECDICGKTLSECTDEDRDYKCDYGCGYEFENNCEHLCHKSGFMSFIWKIINFLSKLFKINPTCECGLAHY